MHAEVVNGMDVLAVREATIERALAERTRIAEERDKAIAERDAALAANAFAWLAKLDGDIPSPKGLNSQILATGGASLAAVLNRPKDADPWLVYCRIRASQAYDNSARMAFCDGLVRLAEGKTKAGVERLTTVLKNAPGMSFAPAAGVIASEALAKAGNAVGAKEIADLVAQTYGDHLAPELQARLTK